MVVQRNGPGGPPAREDAATDDLALEQLATRFAYQAPRDDPRDTSERPRSEQDDRDLAAMGARGARTFTGDFGFSMFVVKRPSPGDPARTEAVVAFRGSDDWQDWVENGHGRGPGAHQFAANEALIVRVLSELGGHVVVTGHSLGGAIAQLTAARHPDLVARVVTFQSPGISNDAREAMQRDPTGRGIPSHHHVVEGDVVPHGGQTHTPGTVTVHASEPTGVVAAAELLDVGVGAGELLEAEDTHTSMPLTAEAQARGTAPSWARIPEFRSERAPTAAPHDTDAISAWGEPARFAVGAQIPENLATARYVRLWEALRTLAEHGSSREELLAVIEGSDQPAEAKQRMRRNLPALLARRAAEARRRQPGSVPASAVQRAGVGSPGPTAAAVQAAAELGFSGSAGGPLPHGAAIQRAFGHHDIAGIAAHVGGAATRGAAAMGAHAYASGGQVAFAAPPDLHLAAHEAAHVVQQRAGVQLAGGVGAAGDAYERHADAVADRVVRGESAEALLDEMVGGGSGGGTSGVQMLTSAQGPEAATLIESLLAANPANAAPIARALDLAISQAGAGPAAVSFRLADEEYQLEVSVAAARQLRPRCDQYAGQTLGANHEAAVSDPAVEAARRARSRPRRHTSVASLRREALGRVIEALGGAVNEGAEIEVEVTLPLEELGIVIGGSLKLVVDHEEHGYKVSVVPRLKAGVGTPRDNLTAFSEFAIEAQGHSGAQAGALVSAGLDSTLRQSQDGLPVFAFALGFATGGGAGLALLADAGIRGWNLMTTGRATSPFWVWLANKIFRDSAARARAAMTEHDYVETRDGVGINAHHDGAGGPSAEIEASDQDRWRMSGARGAREQRYNVVTLHGAISSAARGETSYSGSVDITMPRDAADRDDFPGEVRFQVAGEVEHAGRTEAWILAAIVAGCNVASHLAEGDLDAAIHDLQQRNNEIATAVAGEAQTRLGSSGLEAKVKLELEVTVTPGHAPEVELSAVTELGVEEAGNGVTGSIHRTLVRWP